MIRSLLFFIASFSISFVVVVLLIRYWRFPFGVDHPDAHRKLHRSPILRMGGIPLFIVFFLCMAGVPYYLDQAFYDWGVIFLSTTLIFGLGLADDLRPLGARVKLLGQITIAFIAYNLGLQIEGMSYPVGSMTISLGPWAMVATVLWLIAVPNIVNLIDGVDGLAAGLCLVLYLTLGYLAWTSGAADVSLICFAVAGALLGFLCFNFPPAKIFLGDGGAYFLGFGIAALSLRTAEKGSVAAILLVTMIAMGLPILDTVFAVLRRGLRGFPLFRADAEHIHHRLKLIGFSERRIVILAYLITTFLSLMALSVFWSQGRTLPIALGIVFLLAVVAIRYLGYVWRWSDLTFQVQKALGRRKGVQYVLTSARLASMEVDRCQTLEEFRTEFNRILQRCGFEICPGGGSTEATCYEMHFAGVKPWRVWFVSTSGHHDHLVRLVECFREAYLKACHKWEVEELFPQ